MDLKASATLLNGSVISGDPWAVDLAVKLDVSYAERERHWVADLRKDGVKAAHPDDGWVKRDQSKVHLCYPQFNDGLGVGDLLALGWADRWRVVRITATEKPSPLCSVLGIDPWFYVFEAAL